MAPEPPTDGDTGSPWIGAVFALLALLVIGALATSILKETREPPAAPHPEATDEIPHASAAHRRPTSDAGGPIAAHPSDAGRTTTDHDGGSPNILTLRKIKSLLDGTQLLQRNAAEAAANIERFCAEAGQLPKHIFDDPPSSDPAQLRDAAYFLEPLVSWTTHPRSQGLLQLPTALTDKLAAAHGDWATALTAADTAGIDFSWMGQLSAFDIWSLASVGAVADQAATVAPFDAPIPDYALLVSYAKLRYVRALAQGDLVAATDQVQHLADLLHSNGILLADIQAARMVALQQALALAAAQRGYPSLTPAVLDSAGYDHFHDLSMASVAFSFPGVDGAVLKRALDCAPDPCAMINDAVAVHREMDLLSDQEDQDPFWGLVANRSCDPSLFDLIQGSPTGSLESMAGYLSGEPLPLEKLFGPGIIPGPAEAQP